MKKMSTPLYVKDGNTFVCNDCKTKWNKKQYYQALDKYQMKKCCVAFNGEQIVCRNNCRRDGGVRIHMKNGSLYI